MHGAEQAAEDEARQHLGRGDAGVERQARHVPHLHRFLGHHRQRRDDERRNAKQARAPIATPPGTPPAARRSPRCRAPPARRSPSLMPAPRAISSRSISRLTYSWTLGCVRRFSGSSRSGMSITISSMMLPGPAAHHQHAVGQGDRLLQIVGDQQRGLAGALERLRQLALQHHAGLRVDRRERLVEQQHGRIDRERARQRHALPHAAGELVRVVAGEFRELEVLQERLRAPPALVGGDALDLDAEHHVLRRPCATAAAGPSAA